MGSSRLPSTSGESETHYYLSLGDSLSTGVQPIGPESFQFRTDFGYADQLCSIASSRLPGLCAVKLGYPGESTATMLDGSLGSYPHGNQLAEAVAFLLAHRGEVAFVTIDIGSNDFPTRDIEGSSGYWGKFKDPFDPTFLENARKAINVVCQSWRI